MENLEARMRALEIENAELKAHIAKQDIHIAKQDAQIADLLKRLNKNSNNSSKPPSSDGLKKPPPKPNSLREKGKNKRGGQFGHKGHTLKQSENPDVIENHDVLICEHCQESLADVVVKSYANRQVIDIPIPQPIVTEHRLAVKKCPCCGKNTTAQAPPGVNFPIQYGSNIQAISVYLSTVQFIPEDRLQNLFVDVFQVSISTASLVKFNKDFAERLIPINEDIEQALLNSPLKHLDETGYRVGGKTNWLHVLCNSLYTKYFPKQKRGAIPSGLKNKIVHDHFKSYYSVPDVEHVLCNAHHLRELKSLMENEKKEIWAKRMFVFLKFLSHIAKNQLPVKSQAKISRIYDKIVQQGFDYHESLYVFDPYPTRKNRPRHRDGHNLLFRLQKYKLDVLRFTTHPEIPFTNNQAEQDIRMMKVKQKISGGFRTQQGADVFCGIRGFLSTCRKQGYNLLHSIRDALIGYPPNFI